MNNTTNENEAQNPGGTATEPLSPTQARYMAEGQVRGHLTVDVGKVEVVSSSDDDEFHQHMLIQALGLFEMDDECVEMLQHGQYPQHELVVKFCYGIADAMLAERVKRRESVTSAGSGDRSSKA